ncbi:MAG TPA: 16S rRNA (cytosine(967)-C(5))-methyltransferase RsmB [Gammaproteobacteria bacterium]|nr:16S rRNA (cytosine(967)-C(5))-methyltransferase RsmB [Gammaproteobacteria bacterium]
MGPRQAAVAALMEVLEQRRSLTAALAPLPRRLPEPRDRALAQELCYGTLRWYPRLNVVLGDLLDRPLKARDADIRCLLLVGLYQLSHMAVASHAAVHETVEVARALGKPWAARLVNGVLRRYQREARTREASADRVPAARYAHPQWLLDRLRADWPGHWEVVTAANNARPPMTLRVNGRRGSREAYCGRLADAGLEARVAPHTTHGLTLEAPVPVEQLPDFGSGAVSVQDGAAQLAAQLLQVEPGMRVLDMCAAPGGKTAHILETADCDLTALDIDPARLEKVRENLGRLGLEASLVAADGAQPGSWWDGRPFHRILLDAPCTATGVIRRHPDIKVLRRSRDVDALVSQQQALLAAVWSLLAPGGILLYATCSVLVEENAQQMARFLAAQPGARECAIDGPWGTTCAHGRQILPGEEAMDGFYYALLAKP